MKASEQPSSNKASLLSKWKERKAKAQEQPTARRLPEGSSVPLSHGQRRLWYLQQMHPNNPFYHFADAYRIKGDFDGTVFLESVKEVAERHAILRTVFEAKGNGVFQKTKEGEGLETRFIKLDDLPEKERQNALERHLHQITTAPFDLGNGPLGRAVVFCLNEKEHLVVLAIHHIIIDQWSVQLFWREASGIYRNRKAGIMEGLSPLTYQYADFAHWQSQQQVEDSSLAYWKNQLSGDLPVLNLPLDRPRPPVPSYKGAFEKQRLSPELTDQLNQLAKAAQTTPFILLLAAYKIWLHRYTGQADVLVGTPVTNRGQVDFEQLIGFFLETIVLRSDLSGSPSCMEFIGQVRQTVLGSFSHKNVPFEWVVKELRFNAGQPSGALEATRSEGVLPRGSLQATPSVRVANASPLFQTMFVYHVAEAEPSFGEGVEVGHMPVLIDAAKFDLTLHVSVEDDQLTAFFEYATDLFDQPTVKRMLAHFCTLLENLVADPAQDVAAIGILPKTEKERTLHEWNATQTDLPNVPNIHFWIEEQAEKYPEKVAVVFQNEQLTYQELDEKANDLAAFLIHLEVQPNTFVGLYTERSVEMVVGILGILKAGGAYLPLDPNYPAERLRLMIEDAGVSVVVTNGGYVEGIEGAPFKIVDINDLPPISKKPQPVVNQSDAAYIIYTSGSTGRPKGVVVSHGNLVHSTFARFHYYPQPPSAFLLMSSFAFDSSVAGIFWTLCSGGKLVVPPYRIEQDVAALADIIEKNGVSHTLLLPSLYAMVLENVADESEAKSGSPPRPPQGGTDLFFDERSGKKNSNLASGISSATGVSPFEGGRGVKNTLSKLRSLKAVIVAGEACPGSLCRLHFSHFAEGTLLFNEYGPTEATVWCTVHQLQKADGAGAVPIGRPIPNAQNYILDKNLQPVPVGVAGDLYIGGLGITKGYHNQPALTAERFIKTPFHEGLLYKTGDLASYRPDGTILFLGRADNQVKIRGFRIELEEIREAIKQQEGVEDAHVVIHQGVEKETDEVGQIAQLLGHLDADEAERLLQSVEASQPRRDGIS